jgi:WD40 repeat protein
MEIRNGKKDTELYYLDQELLFISPSITLNTVSTSFESLERFEQYTGTPFSNFIYFYFDYNEMSRQELLYNQNTAETIEMDRDKYYTYKTGTNGDFLVLLGQDRLVRVIDQAGTLISEFGKDRKINSTFRGEELTKYSLINCFDISPNSNFIVTGDERGKITIWERE